MGSTPGWRSVARLRHTGPVCYGYCCRSSYLANIIAHSYQGDTAQRIDLTVLITPEELAVEIRDYGSKPDLATIQPRALHEVRPGGLGTHFMRAIMDTVTYDVSPDTGTLLRMTKRRSESCTSP